MNSCPDGMHAENLRSILLELPKYIMVRALGNASVVTSRRRLGITGTSGKGRLQESWGNRPTGGYAFRRTISWPPSAAEHLPDSVSTAG